MFFRIDFKYINVLNVYFLKNILLSFFYNWAKLFIFKEIYVSESLEFVLLSLI